LWRRDERKTEVLFPHNHTHQSSHKKMKVAHGCLCEKRMMSATPVAVDTSSSSSSSHKQMSREGGKRNRTTAKEGRLVLFFV